MLVVPAKLLRQSQEDIVLLHLEVKYAEDLYRTLIVRCYKNRVLETRFSSKFRDTTWLNYPVENLVIAPDYVLEHISVKLSGKFIVKIDADVLESANCVRTKAKVNQEVESLFAGVDFSYG